ncbi:nucleolin 2-like [Cyclopterus lumpus]|uniref:OTU deubiquitinase with linear linkage specificity a n=1 Tax=Cyclopterus lumpus TaxID=8103 RepID=A0A8C3AAV6_CYCLU|nr:nucleolin 2-like [Cyclopterus lumpus]XP_034415465.1 nucleolin 2-like [Cyclopterus lumpus]XP_034415466.1 nucleolin 2-like [Cyclopterus lumpus]XP_034415468.1 nucleolin 2-like [Cyclopterus lumpus]XP_034415469.1 nucleolin 2-like [Cyclopterus lumpus]XP_034415470.1 nucleolin 2-like [Cyclopterus lumpus]XP_034415471.1 nucleolin 2-like [Cyclopterus lumpus]
MGNACCTNERPCGSVEEKSDLLKDDSKVMGPSGETGVVGTCGPVGQDGIRKMPNEADTKVEEAVQVKRSPEAAETEPNNTQENGSLQKEVPQTATPSPSKVSELKENPVGVRDDDVKDRPAHSGPAELMQCTLNSLQKEHATVDWEVFTAATAATEQENPVSEQDETPESSSPTAEAARPEKLAETNTETEHITLDNTHDDDEEEEEAGSKVTMENTVAEPSGEFSQNNEVMSVPNPQLTAAAAETTSVSVSPENDEESPACAVTEDSENGSPSVCKEGGLEVMKSHEVCEAPPGSEPTGLDHSGEERDPANCVREPEPTAPSDASESSKSDREAEPDVECATMSSKEVTSLEDIKQEIEEELMVEGQVKEEDVPKVEEEIKEEAAEEEADTETGKDAEIQEVTGKEEQPAVSVSPDVNAAEASARKEEDSSGDGMGNSEEDLYRGAEELSASQHNKPETTVVKVEDRCSLGPLVEILSYSEREWKGNTAKSALIRKGYKEMSQRFGSVRRVRGDNYCALRATLFQVLSHSAQLPAWLQEQDVNLLLKQLEAQEGLISQWTFPGDRLQGDGTGDATLQLKGYMELLRNQWQAAVDCSSAAERQQLCERVFRGGEEELGLLEALKLLMLGRAVELHGRMTGGGDVPLFCWLLFARDSSDGPRSFLSNHLSHVGLGAGLEQVEMFLLGYALQCTIQVYRLYKADTEEFVTYYPDDHKDDWPSVCLVTEDDRHYNVPVVEAAGERQEPLGSS